MRMGLRSRSLSQGSSLYLVALAAYALGVWLHIPYGGGHVYSDLVTVFQVRECSSGQCVILIPYVQTFFEYPVVDSMFMYAMGIHEHGVDRSEEHTSELQSRRDLVCRLLLE